MNTTSQTGRILTVCVSKPKTVEFNGRRVRTAIFKNPVEGKLHLSKLNLDGDQVADPRYHGGPDKAVYSYASEHYQWWQEQMPDTKFSYGQFGENLTTEGLLESEICIGDEFQAGTAVIKVAQPRTPCYKLGVRFGRADVIKRFLHSGHSGIYFSVVEEGELGAGDEIRFLRSDKHKVNLRAVATLFTGGTPPDMEFVRRALDSQLAQEAKDMIRSHVSQFD